MDGSFPYLSETKVFKYTLSESFKISCDPGHSSSGFQKVLTLSKKIKTNFWGICAVPVHYIELL